MDGLYSIINSVLTLGAAIAIGFACFKSGYLPKSINPALSKLVVKLTLPIMIATSLTKTSLTPEKLISSAAVIICGMLTIAALMLTGIITERIFKKSAPIFLHRCMTSFGNVVFIAYPLISSLYGDEGLFYAALFAFASDCWLWTIGVFSLSKINNSSASKLQNLKKLINPSTIAFAVSFVMMSLGLKFTGIPAEVLNGIGSVTTYTSMLFIGGVLAELNFKNLYKQTPVFVLAFLKLIFIPALLIFALKPIPIPEMVKNVVVLQAAMPVSTVLVMLCSEYGGDSEYSAGGVLLTTLMSIVTLPLIYYLCGVL